MKSIRSEMNKFIQDRLEVGQLTSMVQLLDGVMSAHPGIEGEDAPFYRVHTYRDLRHDAKNVIGKYAPGASTPDYLLFPGFRHLCRAYSVQRDGDIVIVPVDQCTDAELMERAEQLEDIAQGCRSHAKEIRDYLMARGREAA